MNRRGVLAGVVTTALAGCLQSESADPPATTDDELEPEPVDDAEGASDDPETTESDPDPTEPDRPTHTVSVATVDAVPEEYDLVIDVDLLIEGIGPEETARVAVTTTNAGDERLLSVEEGQCSLFDRADGVSVDGGLVLKREAVADPDGRDGERWTRDVDPDEPRAYDGYGCAGREFSADESITNVYAVWDDYRTAGYLEAGTYRFENEVAVATDERNVRDDPDATFVWGFELEVRPVEDDDSTKEGNETGDQ
ncbi:hypothetical protein [Natrononativus amylolyticus]|uniref:hypothetical protein n=1 Tax=Natrononativus amylolyticus TaxID=2963434 RepID=UPI0020CE0F39|nr:hypothetical protein [Natrononativus amylolyticus]